MTSRTARLASLSLAIAALSLAGLVFTQLWQVIGRYLFDSTPGWTETISMLLMNAAMMFGAAGGVRAGAHFSFVLGIEQLPPVASRAMFASGQLLVGLLGAVMAFYGWRLLSDTWPVKVAGAPLPQGLVYVPLFIGGILIALFAFERGLSILRSRTVDP
jgi:TRAP-type C4-dicarboxylate transport system permease small subunit